MVRSWNWTDQALLRGTSAVMDNDDPIDGAFSVGDCERRYRTGFTLASACDFVLYLVLLAVHFVS